MRTPVPIKRNEQTMTVADAARSLRITPSLLYRTVREGGLRAQAQGGRVLLRRRDVDAYRRRRDRWLRLHGRK